MMIIASYSLIQQLDDKSLDEAIGNWQKLLVLYKSNRIGTVPRKNASPQKVWRTLALMSNDTNALLHDQFIPWVM